MYGGQFAGLGEELLAGEPLLEAAVAPTGEIHFADGLTAELSVQDGPDFRKGIEPIEDFRSGTGIVEAVVDLLTDGVRQQGDFTVSNHNFGFFGVSNR